MAVPKKIKRDMVDVLEDVLDKDILEVLLLDHSSNSHIIWATNDYQTFGESYSFDRQITTDLITGRNGEIIKPRVKKDLDTQMQRSKGKAEVFTPSWVCNVQNNIIDDAWFGKHTNRFNKELGTTWESTYSRKEAGDTRDRIKFPKGKTWKDYVLSNRLEISCGEAPYLTSRYDTVTGKYIKPKNRIGLLDRKLRVITENVPNAAVWLYWAEKALQSIYGYEWQGDNVLLARENLLWAVIEYYKEVYKSIPKKERLLRFAEIISWNIWQMDGIKYVIPESCHNTESIEWQIVDNSYAQVPVTMICPGCKNGNKHLHNGTYAIIKDWTNNTTSRFIDVTKEVKK